MAEFGFDIPKELFDVLSRLENSSDIAQKMLKGSAPILEKSMRAKISMHNRTGELSDSIKARTPKETNGGWYVFVGPSGYSTTSMYFAKNARGARTNRKYKLSNAAKAVWIEYGTSRQRATPFLQKATNDANDDVIEMMQKIFNEVVGE